MMLKNLFVIVAIGIAAVALVPGQNSNLQNTNSSATRTRSAAPKPTPTPKPEGAATQSANRRTTEQPSESNGVVAAFNRIIDGIKKANVNLVMSGYSKDPSPIFFNYNGTVTKGWEQMRSNRESSYRDIKDVTLDVRDLHVTMLGRDGAVVTCLWTQTQTYKGEPDTASGRMTLAFKRVGTEWKAVHLHTSPDKPEPSRIPPSEQTPQMPKPTP
jgi:ketosteroid isomerase-like protein